MGLAGKIFENPLADIIWGSGFIVAISGWCYPQEGSVSTSHEKLKKTMFSLENEMKQIGIRLPSSENSTVVDMVDYSKDGSVTELGSLDALKDSSYK
jgi:hypothetical protein